MAQRLRVVTKAPSSTAGLRPASNKPRPLRKNRLRKCLTAGFGSLGEENIVTDWTNQVQNQFTVTAGDITAYAFFVETGSTCNDAALVFGSDEAYGCYGNFPTLNEFESSVSVFGYNENGAAGVTFTEVASVPEPSGRGVFTIGLIATAGLVFRRGRKVAPYGFA